VRTVDVFGVLGRPRLGDPVEPLFMCPIPGSNGLFIVHRADGSLVATNALTEAEARNLSSNMQPKDPGDPTCQMPAGQPAMYACPIGGGKFQMTDLLTGQRFADPADGNRIDNVLCPGYAERQAAPPPPPPPPPPGPAPAPPPQHGGTIVIVPYPQPMPYPMQNDLLCSIDPISGGQICRPNLYQAPPPVATAPAAPAPSAQKAPAAPAPAPSSGISPLAIAGGAGALGLVTLLATGVIKL